MAQPMNRTLTLLLGAALCSGWGTISTTFTADEVARERLKAMRTHCSILPRVYSGISYDFCVLHAAPGDFGRFAPSLPLVLSDMLLSGIADTVTLPYTLFLQHREGSLELP
jgi:hypothetical protein